MASWIALLRGINVGGRNKLPMADLRALCEELGWRDVQTYIQSGNVVFRLPDEIVVPEGLTEGITGEVNRKTS